MVLLDVLPLLSLVKDFLVELVSFDFFGRLDLSDQVRSFFNEFVASHSRESSCQIFRKDVESRKALLLDLQNLLFLLISLINQGRLLEAQFSGVAVWLALFPAV